MLPTMELVTSMEMETLTPTPTSTLVEFKTLETELLMELLTTTLTLTSMFARLSMDVTSTHMDGLLTIHQPSSTSLDLLLSAVTAPFKAMFNHLLISQSNTNLASTISAL